jgi:hypothetical protein
MLAVPDEATNSNRPPGRAGLPADDSIPSGEKVERTKANAQKNVAFAQAVIADDVQTVFKRVVQPDFFNLVTSQAWISTGTRVYVSGWLSGLVREVSTLLELPWSVPTK